MKVEVRKLECLNEWLKELTHLSRPASSTFCGSVSFPFTRLAVCADGDGGRACRGGVYLSCRTEDAGLGRFRLHIFPYAAVKTVRFESGAYVGVVLARGAGRALSQGGKLNAIATNRTVFAVSDSGGSGVGIELSCRADGALGVVLGAVVPADGTQLACPSSSGLAGASRTCGIGGAASVVSVRPTSTRAGGAGGFAGGGGVGRASARRASTRRFVFSWRAVHATIGTESSSGRSLARLATCTIIYIPLIIITLVTYRAKE